MDKYLDTTVAGVPHYDKVFFSRQRYLDKGRLLGVSAIEKVFEENGFRIIQPELLELSDQLRLISNASYICMEEGSALHLLDLLGKKSSLDLTIISRIGFNSGYWNKMYISKISKIHIFDKVFPMHRFFGTDSAASQSFAHPDLLSNFLKNINLEFNSSEFICDYVHQVKKDMVTLGLNFP